MVLMYHNIAEKSGPNTVSVADFESQMRYISQRYQPVKVPEYIRLLNPHLSPKIITVTFDDAYISIGDYVLPVLKKYGIPAMVFVPVNHVGGYNAWDGGHNKTAILDWDAIIELDKEPLLDFESHGCNHVSFGHIDDAERQFEFAESKAVLEEKLKRPVRYFAYPFGQLEHRGPNDVRFLRDNGYAAAFTTNWSRRNTVADAYALNRIDVKPETAFPAFRALLKKPVEMRYYKQVLKNILFRLKF